MTPARSPWRPLSAGIAAAGLAGVLCPSLPAAATPVPCVRAERYAAEAGTELLHVNRLDLGPTGRKGTPVTDVGLGDTRTAMVAEATVNSASAVRMLAGQPTDPATAPSLTRPVQQQAPPTTPAAARADTAAARVGPLALGDGVSTSRARWDASMGCGRGTGEITRASAVMQRAAILPAGPGRTLVRVPQRMEARSTTALERRGTHVHAVARAALGLRRFELLGGKVRVTVVRAPTLATSISAAGSAEVRYVPAILDVAGDGIRTARLAAAGDRAEITLGGDPPATHPQVESNAGEPDPPVPGVPGDPLGTLLSGIPADALGGVTSGPALQPPGVPVRPGVPPLAPGSTESGRDPGYTDRTVRIMVGDVRQAVAGHAVAARAAAVRVTITGGPSPTGGAGEQAGSSTRSGGVVLDLDIGVLEAAAVAPEPAGGAAAGQEPAGGGLPVTGARVDLMMAAGVVLLAGGAVFLVVGLRRRAGRR